MSETYVEPCTECAWVLGHSQFCSKGKSLAERTALLAEIEEKAKGLQGWIEMKNGLRPTYNEKNGKWIRRDDLLAMLEAMKNV